MAQIHTPPDTDEQARQAGAPVVDTTASPHAQLCPVALGSVTLSDTFWTPRRRVNREVTLPSQFRHLEETDRLNNFRRAAGKLDAPFVGIYFNDSDVYKWLEAAAWTLAEEPNSELEAMIDTAIAVIADAQRDDGYLNTYFALDKADDRWTNFDLHEMYCAGHLFQAAVAHVRATGKTTLLDVATRFADHICDTFGPEAEGKREALDGREEVELGLVELYRATGEKRYLEGARYFVEARGYGLLERPYGHFNSEYAQDHVPIREVDTVVGHAVRALYYAAGVADVYAETGDAGYLTALQRQWENMTGRRMYVSGGVGSRYEGEAFGKDYELPNARAYTETCAAIASVMWNWRMLALNGDARYSDLLEWTLYDAVLPGLSLDGQHYFYQNPLADDGAHRRQAWFGCACCPPNVARLLASLPGYFYSTSEDALWVHLYAEGRLETTLENGQRVVLEQTTGYPWDGEVTLNVQTEDSTFALRLRIPSWAQGATLRVNGEVVEDVQAGSYTRLLRDWRKGDTVELSLPMPVRYLEAHPYVTENTGCVALARGPLLYCIEGLDQRVDVRNLYAPAAQETLQIAASDELGGVMMLRGETVVRVADEAAYLYRDLAPATLAETERRVAASLVAVPYYSWANREESPMLVWLRRQG